MAYLLAFLKYVIYGLSIFFTAELESTVDVLDILALRFLLSFLFIWLLKALGIFKIRLTVRELFSGGEREKHIPALLLAAMFEPVLYMLFETLGILFTTSITAAVILSLTPITNCIAEELILKEKSTLIEKIFLTLGCLGVIYIAVNGSSRDGEDSIIGVVFMLFAVICSTLFCVFSRKSSKNFAPLEITYASSMLGALIFNAVNIVRHIAARDILHYFDPFFSLPNLVGFVFLGIVCAVLASVIGNYCLSRMQISVTAAFTGVSTLVSVIAGVFLRDERLYFYHFVGLSLIALRMIGVTLISARREKKKKEENEGTKKSKNDTISAPYGTK